jgi:alkylated DNA repair dioxygenase AlkB
MHEQIDIFAAAANLQREHIERDGDLPADFVVVPHFISNAEERALLESIDASAWNTDLKRRVQQYGYRYDYKARAVSERDRLGDLPQWAIPIAARLVDCDYFDAMPDQVIVNEYLAGQGISSHTDRTTCFGPVIASLSLGSDVIMNFNESNGRAGSIVLPRCSLLVLQGAARSKWRHGIAQRRRDAINSTAFQRNRRVSLTFRSVLLSEEPPAQ